MGRLHRRAVHAVNLSDGKPLPARLVDLIGRRYDGIVADRIAMHEFLPPPGKRGRRKRRRGHNLALRLRDNREGVLRFTRDPAVPATNNDVNRFTTSGLLRDLFEIDWSRSKFHQPGFDSQNARNLFQSQYYVVRLKDDRTALAEYVRFEGLWCEVRVQTTLNRAWAGMAHDIIYKRSRIKGFGDRETAMIERVQSAGLGLDVNWVQVGRDQQGGI